MSAPTSGITKISPSSGPASGGTLVTIHGSGLRGASVVKFGGTNVNVKSATDSKITAIAPAGTGTDAIGVNLPTGWITAPSSVKFQYISPGIKKVSPAVGPTSGGTTVTITGSGLSGATAVSFGATQANVASVSDTVVTVVAPTVTTTGTVAIQVMLPTGPTPKTPAATFEFLAPKITGIKPDAGPLTGGTKVTITGNYLGTATSVQFDGVAASAPPVILSDHEITVITPPMTGQKDAAVQVNLPTGLVPAKKSDAKTFKFGPPGPPVNATFVIRNETGIPDSLVFVKFLGAAINSDTVTQTYAGTKPLENGTATASRSYSLAEMTSSLTLGGAPAAVPNFALNNFSGGRIYFSLISPLASTGIPAAQSAKDPDFNKVYGYVEPSVFPNLIAGSTNIDASYVDFVGIPINIAIRKVADKSLLNPPANNPLLTPSGDTLFKALKNDAAIPPAAVVPAIGSAKLSPDKKISISGTARILSPSLYDPTQIPGATPYHAWTGTSSLIAALRAAGTVLTVASYTSADSGAVVPSGTLFGFSGSKGPSPISGAWLVAQSYKLTAVALADLNPKGANTRIPSLQGVSGIKLSGSGGTVNRFDIYLKDTDLNQPTGVYGANPPYVVDWIDAPGGAAATSVNGIKNDLAGRVIGDLLAGFNFGWAACATTVAAQAKSSGTSANLSGTVFDTTNGPLAGQSIGALTTGQFFYLLSLQPTTTAVSAWFGQSIQPGNPSFYNNYASDFQKLTQCYNMAFTDRLQGPCDPDMFFAPDPGSYVEIVLQKGDFQTKIS